MWQQAPEGPEPRPCAETRAHPRGEVCVSRGGGTRGSFVRPLRACEAGQTRPPAGAPLAAQGAVRLSPGSQESEEAAGPGRGQPPWPLRFRPPHCPLGTAETVPHPTLFQREDLSPPLPVHICGHRSPQYVC